jgi:23S rRNA (uracil1939-C5)-methyltransferase
MHPGEIVTLEIEKPAVGGRMLSRHNGQVVLVLGAIPGERINARVERTAKSLAFAETVEVLDASADRRSGAIDFRCGGNVYAHIQYDRQRELKSEIIRDAFSRIARTPLAGRPDVIASPEHAYRIRSRLHCSAYRLGFYREGTHEICDAAATSQLTPGANEWIASAQQALERDSLRGLVGVEMTENVQGSERVCHLELKTDADTAPYRVLADGLTGLSAQRVDRPDVVVLAGKPSVTDEIEVAQGGPRLRLRRDASAFFQGNRYLVQPLVNHVLERVPEGPVLDLYAGVGLFGLSIAARGTDDVTLVEGDPISGADLDENARPFAQRVRVERRSVESFLLRGGPARPPSAVVIDPPRTGVSKEAMAALVRLRAPRLVYVSCDVATLARDSRVLLDAGYLLTEITGIDLFPGTAHVETIAVFGGT